MSNLDVASFGAGFGAGQSGARAEADFALNEAASQSRRADMAADQASRSADRARRGAESSHEAALAASGMATAIAVELQITRNEISNRWIPYAVTLKASLMARKFERNILIEELRRFDPANADQIAKKADEAGLIEYDRIEASEVREIVLTESEAERTDK